MITLLLLVALIKVSIHYNNPPVLAGVYTLLTLVIGAAMGVDTAVLAVSTVLTFWLTWLFFWLLDRYDESGAWWAIAIGFPVLMFVLSSLA